MSTVIRVEALSKRYRLGVVNRKMLYEEIRSRWAHWRGREDPNAGVHQRHHGAGSELWALKDVGFEVKDGDVLGIIGSNGSGKSTLLKILSQITAPTAGRALIKGKVASLLEVGTGFHPELTGRDNIFLNGVILGMRHEEVARKLDEIVAFSGVEAFIETPVKRYSSGMRMRLAFAVASSLDPQILIIDEVLAVGDAAFQQKCLGKIGEAARSGRTVLFVSHDAAAVEALCTRGLVLAEGRLVFDGTQRDAIALYSKRQQPAARSLRQRTDREGSGQIRVVAIELRDPAGHRLSHARSGQDVEIWLHFERRAEEMFPQLTVRLSVLTEFGAPVFTQLNDLTHIRFGPLPSSGAFVCRLSRLPLAPALYRFDYRLVTSRRGGSLIDALTGAAPFHVESGRFFPNSDLPSPRAGVCLVDGEWRLEPASAPAAAMELQNA